MEHCLVCLILLLISYGTPFSPSYTLSISYGTLFSLSYTAVNQLWNTVKAVLYCRQSVMEHRLVCLILLLISYGTPLRPSYTAVNQLWNTV
jgi:hypothetical protein